MPTSHAFVFVWLAAGMASFAVTDLRRKFFRFVLDWSPFMGVLFIYDRLRGYADGLLVHPREVPQIKVEAALFGRPIPTVWLQYAPVARRERPPLVGLRDVVHLPDALRRDAARRRDPLDVGAPPLRAVRDDGLRPRAHGLRDLCALSRGAAVDGGAARCRSAQSHRTVKLVWPHVPVAEYGNIFEGGEHYANNVAAMPSLHAAYALLVVLFLWRLSPWWVRPLLALYPPAMAFSLVYGGEHYVVDCIAGWAYAAFAYFSVEYVFARRAARQRVPRAGARRLNEIAQVHFCDVTVDGERWPVIGWTIATAGGTVLVDTGMVDSTPELDADWGPVIYDWDVPDLVAVINTHLHFDHCGGNRRYAGLPTYVQRRELESALAPAYLEEWVRFPGESYVELDGDTELFDGVSVLFTPGHSAGHQAVVVQNDDGLVVLGGDVTYSMRELIDGATDSIRRIHELRPSQVYLAHHERPWVPEYD